jgi:hypothetical protein
LEPENHKKYATPAPSKYFDAAPASDYNILHHIGRQNFVKEQKYKGTFSRKKNFEKYLF